MSARIPRTHGSVLISAPLNAPLAERFAVSRMFKGSLYLLRTDQEAQLDQIAREWDGDNFCLHPPTLTRALDFPAP